jgi:protein-S-isoprenylcysteine O-methyltransferase Ste14
LIEAARWVGPPIFFGNAGATTASVVAFWVVFYIWIGGEFWLGYRRRELPSGAAGHDSGSRILLISSIWATVALGVGLAFVFPDAAITTGRNWVFGAGLVLMIAGLGLRWYSIWVLGASFTCEVATRPGQEVVQSGPYRWVRHPSYTGGLLTIVGVLLCCVNLASLAALVVAAAGYAYRITVEERALANDLGPAYRDYMRHTKRLIPFVI